MVKIFVYILFPPIALAPSPLPTFLQVNYETFHYILFHPYSLIQTLPTSVIKPMYAISSRDFFFSAKSVRLIRLVYFSPQVQIPRPPRPSHHPLSNQG